MPLRKNQLFLLTSTLFVVGITPLAQAIESPPTSLGIGRAADLPSPEVSFGVGRSHDMATPAVSFGVEKAEDLASHAASFGIARPTGTEIAGESFPISFGIARKAIIPGSGDLDGDGRIDASDVTLLLLIYLGLRFPTPEELKAGDVMPRATTGNSTQGDGQILASDLNRIFRLFLGLETIP